MKTAPGLNERSRTPKRRKVREHTLAHTATVVVEGYRYRVDLGPHGCPRVHYVNKRKECSCGGPYCEAIDAVRQYLLAGGARAPGPEGMPPCPVCGGKTFRDRDWDGKYTKELGWRCKNGGLRHFLEAKAARIQERLAARPWILSPIPGDPGRDGRTG